MILSKYAGVLLVEFHINRLIVLWDTASIYRFPPQSFPLTAPASGLFRSPLQWSGRVSICHAFGGSARTVYANPNTDAQVIVKHAFYGVPTIAFCGVLTIAFCGRGLGAPG